MRHSRRHKQKNGSTFDFTFFYLFFLCSSRSSHTQGDKGLERHLGRRQSTTKVHLGCNRQKLAWWPTDDWQSDKKGDGEGSTKGRKEPEVYGFWKKSCKARAARERAVAGGLRNHTMKILEDVEALLKGRKGCLGATTKK